MLAGTHVFSVDGESYCWRDVVLAAARRGDWQAAITRAREGAACAMHAQATGNPLAEGAVDAAAREFRYARDLVTAESMERWLARRMIAVGEWTAALERALLLRRDAPSTDELVPRYNVADEAAERSALVDVLCSAEADRWITSLAEAAAAHAHMLSLVLGEHTPDDEPSATVVDDLPLRLFEGENAAAMRSSARRLDSMDVSLSRFRSMAVTERALRDHVNARRIDWVRVDCRVMRFPTESMAAEAALMLRDDGDSFTAVFQVAHAAEDRSRFFLDHVDEQQREVFLGARAGDVVGPLIVDGEYRLYEIEQKTLPSLASDDVRERAEREVMRKALRHQVEQRVRWPAR